MRGFEHAQIVKRVSPGTSAMLHALVAVLGLIGAWGAWRLWFTAGGWDRRNHWADGLFWAFSAIVGIWGAVDAVRLGRKALPSQKGLLAVAMGMVLTLCNGFALLFFLMFLRMLGDGGPR